MSTIAQGIQAASDSADAAIVRTTTDMQAQRDEIARLQAIIDAGEATPAEQEAFDALKAKLDGLDPTNPAILTTKQIKDAHAKHGHKK